MLYRDLREYLQLLEKNELLTRISGASSDLEIGAITELEARSKHPKAMLFDRIVGYPDNFRILTNSLNSAGKTALALGLAHDKDAAKVTKEWKERLKGRRQIPPVKVNGGPIYENVVEGDKVNLLNLPAPRWHENDGGRYLGTGCLVIMKEPDGGWTNLAPYRIQVQDERTATIYISPGKHGRIIMEKYWADGKSCPVAVSLGQDPALFLAGTSPVPFGSSEYDYAGWIRGEPVNVSEARFSGLPIPTGAEVVLDGEIPPVQQESRVEGPFGEYTGYYGHGATPEPVIRVKCILHRNNAIITGEPPMKPPAFNGAHSLVRAALLWNLVENAGVPDIRAVAYHLNGMIVVISIKQRFPGHSRLAAHALLGVGGGEDFRRAVFVVDDDINAFSIEEVMWAFATRCDPDQGVEVARGRTSSPLDPMMSKEKKARGDLTASTQIIDACIPYHRRDEFPITNTISKELAEITLNRWKTFLSQG